MARSLHLTTVAEGVETVEQFDILREQGCEVMQGFFFSAPLSPAAVTKALEKCAKGAAMKSSKARRIGSRRSKPILETPSDSIAGQDI
jgi:predicted signal transduction protein with EAL and GGDEF domain